MPCSLKAVSGLAAVLILPPPSPEPASGQYGTDPSEKTGRHLCGPRSTLTFSTRSGHAAPGASEVSNAKCVDCGDESERVYEVILRPFRSKKGKVHRWKGGICEECLQKRFDGMFNLRPM